MLLSVKIAEELAGNRLSNSLRLWSARSRGGRYCTDECGKSPIAPETVLRRSAKYEPLNGTLPAPPYRSLFVLSTISVWCAILKLPRFVLVGAIRGIEHIPMVPNPLYAKTAAHHLSVIRSSSFRCLSEPLDLKWYITEVQPPTDKTATCRMDQQQANTPKHQSSCRERLKYGARKTMLRHVRLRRAMKGSRPTQGHP